MYYALQERLNLMLVNPSHLRGIRGRKSDPSDAAFLARAGASGMVLGSFVPPRTIRELRDAPAGAPKSARTEAGRSSGWRKNWKTPG